MFGKKFFEIHGREERVAEYLKPFFTNRCVPTSARQAPNIEIDY
jgi:hypothetical protein